jgi:chaperone modulatory protein CbpM
MSFALVRPPRLDRDAFARAAGVHPTLVDRLVALGLLDTDQDSAGELCFDVRQIASVARIQRLRAGLGLNYAACGVVIELLERIEELEASRRRTDLEDRR